MKKIFYLFLIAGLAVTSCNKPTAIAPEQDVIFTAVSLESGLKSSDTDGDICNNDVAHYAKLTIQQLDESGNPISGTSIDKIVDIFYLNGMMYTNTLRLIPGKYQLTAFSLWNQGPDNATGGDDDIMVYATPNVDSEYADLVDALPQAFNVNAFLKNEVPIQVLCFEPAEFDKFGFSWFAIDYTTVDNNDMFFYGDFCTKYFKDYEANEFYDDQMVGGSLSHDMIAIYKIQVLKEDENQDWDLIETYTNETSSVSGEPLIIPHPNTDVVGERFKFKLFILVKDGNSFSYKKFKVWVVTDDEKIDSGDNNIIEFVLGSCTPEADYILPPYMNLPENATLTTISSIPGSLGTYFDVTLSNIGPGYDIQNGNYGVYCADKIAEITLNQEYNMNVFTSLYIDQIPDAFSLQKPILDNINWLGNNLYRYEGHSWRDIQNAVWMLLGQITETENGGALAPTALAIKMKNDARDYGDNYLPPVGGYAAVLFISPDANDTNTVLQLLFTLVDP